MERHDERFDTSLLVLLTVATSSLLTAGCLPALIGGLFNLALAFFIAEWYGLYLNTLTRHLRATFDEANVLETYQPRARTMGHLFVPDPPTPAPGDAEKDEKANAFHQARDAHYANEFTHIMKLNQEVAKTPTEEPKKTAERPPEFVQLCKMFEDDPEGKEL